MTINTQCITVNEVKRMALLVLGRKYRWLLITFFFLAALSASLGAFEASKFDVFSQPSPVKLFTLTPEEKNWIKEHHQIKVAVNHGWAPIAFLSESNEFRGISIDYLSQLENLLGIKFDKIIATESALTESADIIASVTNESLLKNTRFTTLNQPYLTMPVSIFTRENSNDIYTLNDLAHQKVAIFRSGQTTLKLSQEHPNIQLYKEDIAEEALTDLLNKKVEAYIGNQVVINYIAHTQGFRHIKIAGNTPYKVSITMAVRNDWPIFKSILQKGLLAIDANEQQSILARWSEPPDQIIYKKWLFAMGATLIIIMLIFTYRIQKQNQETKLREKKSQEAIWQQANFDALTQLPNRHMFGDRLEQELKKSNRSSLPLAILFLDLDHFKDVNDSLGHGMGDMLLVQVALRLKKCIRSTDTLARFGGDEFTIILSDLKDVACIEIVAYAILREMTKPFQLKDEVVYIGSSIGITIYPEDASDKESLIKNADQAMYAAKSLGRNCFHYFTYAMQEAINWKRHLANDLRSALPEKQLYLLYQPIVELASGNIHKAEALIRWQHPKNGLINPVQFIPVAEDTGTIIPIGDWVFKEAVGQVTKWRTSLQSNFQISINASPVQFKNNGNLQTWIPYLQEHALDGESITIEITEGLLLETKVSVKHQLTEFKTAGIRVAIDDFGTGYSSLSYLKKFELDYVKIDRSFVNNLSTDSDDMVLCEAIILMAHKLKLKVIAEGVETKEQERLLRQAGCDYGQGYLYSKPLTPSDFEIYINKRESIIV